MGSTCPAFARRTLYGLFGKPIPAAAGAGAYAPANRGLNVLKVGLSRVTRSVDSLATLQGLPPPCSVGVGVVATKL